MKINKKLIARSRLRYAQGSGMVGILISLTTLLTFANVFQPTFEKIGIPVQAIYILLPIGYILLCWYVGMIYDTKGFWEEETSHANEFLNPEFSAMCAEIKEMKKTMEEMNERQQRMEQGTTGSLPADCGGDDPKTL
jgi:hypothetical protein